MEEEGAAADTVKVQPLRGQWVGVGGESPTLHCFSEAACAGLRQLETLRVSSLNRKTVYRIGQILATHSAGVSTKY